ncbi:hypothetical protein [Paracoccus everestensis]|uniref:hypothetical protein n=1 Tax=Paracoccus everestensis TaxID=2903900 RepID=UPI001F2976E2|nr:hypothetical protein [Paracoccus everestensis]
MLDTNFATDATKDHLTAARMATLLREAKSPNAVAFREQVLAMLYGVRTTAVEAAGKRYRRPQQEEAAGHARTLDAILCDLLWASDHAEALGFCYRSANRQAFTDGGTKASSRAYEWQVPVLVSAELIDVRVGYTAWDDFDGDSVVLFRRATRMRATPALMAIAQRHGISADNLTDHYHKLTSKLTRLVVLRAGKTAGGRGQMLRYPDTEKAASIWSEVERINAIYSRHQFVGLPQPQVYRLFNCADADGFAFNKGGRLYGEFQNTSKERRKDVTIDGQPVVELDLKASHLTALYGVTNTPMPEGDPYSIEGLPRAVVKGAVTAMIGLGHTALTRWSSKSMAILLADLGTEQPLDAKTFSRRYPARMVAEKVLKRHPVLRHLSPNTLDWADLQFTEGEVLVKVILQLGEEHDIPALPVHDSIIVPKDGAEIARTCLGATFKAVTGQLPMIEMK